MAGAGYKVFNTGDVLTASDVNTYLQQQVVMVFASAAARTSALSAVLAEGMVTYLQDTNSVQVYNGTAFVAVGGSSPLTTKGDLYTFSTVDARLGVGANGTTLVADSSEATGLKWQAPAGGGKVLQVVQATTTTETTIASSSQTDTGITASITPTSASSKILVLSSSSVQLFRDNSGAGQTQNMRYQLLRGATVIAGGAQDAMRLLANVSTNSKIDIIGFFTTTLLDSPATTSATTYKIQAAATAPADGSLIRFQATSTLGQITLLEIGA